MKKTFIFLALLMIIHSALAQNELYSAQQLQLDVKISSQIQLNRTPASEIEYINADLYMFPKDNWRQQVLEEETTPAAKKEEDLIRYRWENVQADRLTYLLESKVLADNKFKKITEKVSFPFSAGNEEKPYLNPTEYMDSDNPEIIKIASQIAEGQDDLFKLENDLANYVKNNVKYNLSTATAEVTQKASWVLKNKVGVCDEITTLFIAMNRAIGVPARYVSGVAYTNSPLFSEPWGSHAWAEVYFPEYGWVPFDITYEEFGYLDATHIEMMTTADAKQASTKFEWKARDINLNTGEMKIETKVITSEGDVEDNVKISPALLYDKAGFGSYNLVEAKIKNIKNYYVPVTVYLGNTQDIETISENPLHLVLEPNEEKNVLWIIKLSDELQRKYVYTFPIAVYTKLGDEGTTRFESDRSQSVYGYDEIKEYYSLKKEEIQKTYSRNIDVNCTPRNSFVYINESEIVRCTIKNSGNTMLEGLQVCMQKCQNMTLLIGQESKIEFSFRPEAEEIAAVMAKNKDISKIYNVPIEVLDIPRAEINSIENPSKVKYDDNYTLKFTLEQTSKSELENLTLKIINKKTEMNMDVDEFDRQLNVSANMIAKNLNEGNNTLSIKATYYDKKGRKYETTEEINVELTELTFFQRVMILIRGIAEAFY